MKCRNHSNKDMARRERKYTTRNMRVKKRKKKEAAEWKKRNEERARRQCLRNELFFVRGRFSLFQENVI